MVQSVRAGVVHRDVQGPNALWSEENRRVILINFKQALLVDSPRPPLAQFVPNKQTRLLAKVGSYKATGQNQHGIIQKDVLAAKVIFQRHL